MMMSHRNIASSKSLLLLFFAKVCQGLVETCDELQAAFDLTKTQDVVVEMRATQDIDCATITTMSMDSNSLTMLSSEDLSIFGGNAGLSQVRFEVKNGAKLTWETNVWFSGPQDQDVNGGALYVGEGSTARFLNDLTMDEVGVRSVTDESSDTSSNPRSGGCVFTDGYFRVDGEATFKDCDNSGGGESAPGPGGVLFVGEQGSVLFNGALEMYSTSIIDDDGGDGGGIYNAGKVNIKGTSRFEALRARNGGAFYNAAGAQFRFENQATAVFVDCTSHDGRGGALYNEGDFEFSGHALFLESQAPAVYVAATGETKLSEDSVFWDSADNSYPAIFVASGGEIDIPSSVSLIDSIESDCSTVFFEEDDTCL